MKYNYIIGTIGGFYDVAFDEIRHLENVRYYSSHLDCFSSRWAKLLCRLNFSRKVNRIIREPFRHFVNKRLYHSELLDRPNTCLVLLGSLTYVFNSSFIAYIRKRYPHVKLVLYCADIVSSNCDLDINRAKLDFDLVISYDQGDAEKYGLLYYPTPYSAMHVAPHGINESDLYFCGKAKNRFNEIIAVYEQAKQRGLSCDFYLYGVRKEEQLYGEDIKYDVPLSYEENVKHVVQSKAVLEIMQHDADGYTPRLWEAITYDKHLFTNNEAIFKSCYYDPRGIHDVKKLREFTSASLSSITYSTDLKNQLSPRQFLTMIASHLSIS